ncbi:hypothetical protein ACNGMK_07960 [Campylobacter coli]
MANLLSPGIQVSEVDQSQITPVEGDSAAVFGGDFEKGPVGVHTLISSVQELRDNYGMPNTKNYNDYYQVQNFLAYSGAIYVSRAADLNGTPTKLDGLLFEENAYKTNVNATKVEGVKVIEADSVDVKFEKTDKFQVGQVLKFNDSNKEYKIKYVRNEVKQIPNPDYQPLTQLVVDPSQASAYVDEVVSYVVTTNAESYTVETDRPDVVLVNKSNKSLTALKVGTAVVTFRATKEGSRPNTFEFILNVQEKEQTKLVVTPETVNILEGQTAMLNIDTDAETYSIVSKNLAIATIAEDKKTINGLRIGSCLVEVSAQANGKTETTKIIDVNVITGIETDLTVSPEGPVTLHKNEEQIFEITTDGFFVLETASEADKEFVTVDTNAKKVTAIKEGNAVVRVRSKVLGADEVIKRIQIIILPEKISATVEPTEINVNTDAGDQTLTVTTEATNISARVIDTSVANVSTQEKIITLTPLAAGNTEIEITVSSEGYSNNIITVPLTVTAVNADPSGTTNQKSKAKKG